MTMQESGSSHPGVGMAWWEGRLEGIEGVDSRERRRGRLGALLGQQVLLMGDKVRAPGVAGRS